MSQINNVNDLRKMIDINTPIIYINDYDFVRVDGLITEVVGAGNENIYEWNPAIGAVNFFTKEPLGGSENNSLREFLHTNFCEFTSYPEETFIVLKEVHSYLADDHDPITKSLLSFIAQSKLYGEGYEVVVIIVSSVLNIPPELEKFTSVYRAQNKPLFTLHAKTHLTTLHISNLTTNVKNSVAKRNVTLR